MALEDGGIREAPPPIPGAAMAGRPAGFGQDHSAACRAGIWRHHPVHPLCARCLPGAAKVICEVQPELEPLLSQLKEDITVVASGQPLPAFDLHCPLLSLPFAFKPADTIPGPFHIWPPPPSVWHIGEIACRRAHPRAGFVWSGQPSHKNDGNRSIALERFAAFFENPLRRSPVLVFRTKLRDADAEVLRGLPNLINLGGDFAISPTPPPSSHCSMS
jgi:hypothetical protein